ncbi:hypothetical protein FV223_12090, partial [Methylobacterium sp. WL116]
MDHLGSMSGPRRGRRPRRGKVRPERARRMVTEKVVAAGEAALIMASGASTAKVIAGYRRKVRANA